MSLKDSPRADTYQRPPTAHISSELRAQRRLIFFAKAPKLGRVKTRLLATAPNVAGQEVTAQADGLSQAQACALYEAFVREAWRRHSAHERRLYVSEPHPFWREALGVEALWRQRGADLGERMYNALTEQLSEAGVSAALLIGTDTPTLSPHAVSEALEALTSAEAQGQALVSFAPAEDGGYVWVGVNKRALSQAASLFKGVAWSTSEVLSESLQRAAEADLKVHLGPSCLDIDELSDLRRFETERARLPPHERPQRGGGFDAVELAPPHDLELKARYHAALERLYALTRFGERMDLSTPRALNEALGDPLSSYQSVIVGGTNGKGSTCAHLGALAEQAGLSVGRFSSPHLISFRERVTIDGRPLEHELMTRGVEAVFEAAERAGVTMSFFEAAWALAAWSFREAGVEWVIWEVGLGGRLDATNVCEPVVSALTSVGLDHTHLLGDTLEQIATEKAAISRPNRPALTGAEGEGLKALLSVAPQFVSCPPLSSALKLALSSGLSGGLYERNAALAVAVAEAAGWPLSEAQRAEALSRAEWPGRLEYLRGVWLDCAHNPHAAEGLARWLTQQRAARPSLTVRCLFGASQDKDIEGVLRLLSPHLDELVWVSPQYMRCERAERLSERYEERLKGAHPSLSLWCTPSVAEALEQVEREAEARLAQSAESAEGLDQPHLTLVTGSCFLVGEARALLLGLPTPEEGLLTTAR